MSTDASPVSRTERFLLAALLLVVPLLEVPKHLFWLAWVGVSLVMLWRGRGHAGQAQSGWQPWDALLGAVLVAALLAGAGFADPGSSLAATGDTLRLVSVPWLMARRGYRVDDCLPLLWAALAGTVLATAWGFIDIFRAAAPMFLELNSVGHVNHSSIYLAIAFGCALGLALAAAGAHPLVGLGNGGFRRLTPERVCAEIIVPPAGQPCDTDRYFFSSHAHSLYANTLAERGLVGLAALLALLGAWALRLRRTLDWARADHRQASIWVASLAGLSVTAFAGLLNTSLHHEHGLLAMATLGMLLAASARPRGMPA